MHQRHPQMLHQFKDLSNKIGRLSPINRVLSQPLRQLRTFWNHLLRRVLSTLIVPHLNQRLLRQMRMRKLQDLSTLSSQCKYLIQLRVVTLRIPLRPKINSLIWSTMANNNSLHNNRSNSSKFQPWLIYQTNWPDFSLDSWIWTSNRKCRMPSETSMSNNRTRINSRLLTRCNSSSCQRNRKICNKSPLVRINSSLRSSNTPVISTRASKTLYRPRHKLLIRNRLHRKLLPRGITIRSRYSMWHRIISTSLQTSTSVRYLITISVCHNRCLSTRCKWAISSRGTLNNPWCKVTSLWAIILYSNLCHKCSNKYNTRISTMTSTCHKITHISNISSLRSLILTFMMRSTRFKNNLIWPKMIESTFCISYKKCAWRFSSLAAMLLVVRAIRRHLSYTATV